MRLGIAEHRPHETDRTRSMQKHPQRFSPAHRHLRPAERRQVVAAERADAAARLHRLRRGRHDHRPGREADGTAADRAGAVHRHGRHRRRRRARRAARAADAAGLRPHRRGPDRRRGGRRGATFEEGILAELPRAKIAGDRRVQQDATSPSRTRTLVDAAEGAEDPVGADRRLRGRGHPRPARGADPRRAGGLHQRPADPRRPGAAPANWWCWWCRSTWRRPRAG